MSRKRMSRAEMGAVVEQWRRSGLGVAEFCRRRGIGPRRLSYWKRALSASEQPRRAGVVSFAPVQVMDLERAGTPCLEVVLTSGERLAVRPGVSAELLREVLQALRERC